MSYHFDILEKQEALLRFSKFDHDVAWNLGCAMVQRAKEQGIVIAVSIRMANGSIVFQHLPEGTNALNERWMRRKFNTVSLMESSSLRATFTVEAKGESLQVHTLPEEDYALCGGGFPVRIQGSEAIAGVVLASNLYHIVDHEFIVDCLRDFLSCPEAPAYPFTLPE